MAGNIIKTAKVIIKTAEKMTINANNGDIILNAAKSIKYSAKKDIIYDSYVAPGAEQTEHLLVTKVTCDVTEVEVGKTYTFKAVQFSRKPKPGGKELENVKWAYRIDDGKIQYFENKGNIIGNTVSKKIEIGKNLWDNKTLKIYAYMQSPIDNVSVDVKILREQKYVALFFIGGAGDAERYYGTGPTEIMKKVMKSFNNIVVNDKKINEIKSHFKKDFHISEYFGYNKVRGKDDIKKNITNKIPDKKNTAVYIIGHSLGGWNGAHLSQILTDRGYNVDLLITLDPVGWGADVQLISDIYGTIPKPKSNYWINIYTNPKNYSMDDFIADYGGQWHPPKDEVQIDHITEYSHRQANPMFKEGLNKTNISASNMLLHFIKEYIKKP